MQARAILLAILLAAIAITASATPHFHDGNDLWIDPNESGWGLNLFHQGDTLFASLFVYGPNGQPKWYTASSLVGDDGGPSHDRPSTYTGALYETTGPGIGGPFDPSRVTRRQVGTMTVELATLYPGRNIARVTYSVDGVNVAKEIVPFSFRRISLAGTYAGYAAAPTSPTGPVRDEMASITITQDGSSVTMTATGSASGSCSYFGTHVPNGHLANVTGNYMCRDGQYGPFAMLDVDVTPYGFTSRFSGPRFSDNFNGALVGARTSGLPRGDGWRTDLWWDPQESGWGLNVIEQGETIFATMFVYDSAGQPRWYSASNVTYDPARSPPPDAASGSTGVYYGVLYESTGPYFGTSFNAAAVTRREVGTLSFEVYGSNTGYLSYSVDGVTVTRKAVQRSTFRANSLAGSYAGQLMAGGYDRGVQTGPMTIDVVDGADTFTMTMKGSRGQCTLTTPRSGVTQYGQQVRISADYFCGSTRIGRMDMYDLEPSWPGFTGTITLDGYYIGRIGAARTSAH